ncbi:MAG TPA: hypothetical protein ENH59_05335 [Bacteroidetes bacterium]|nr:hypothetical protein [Bacteroidota bacterium]
MEPSDKIIIEDLKGIIKMQAQELAKIPILLARIESLEHELLRYKTKKDSSNSSVPPSKDENRPPRTSSLREKSGRKAGGRPGHDGKTLKMTDNPDEIIEHRACFCPECGKDVSGQPYSGKLIISSILILPSFPQHSPACGTLALLGSSFHPLPHFILVSFYFYLVSFTSPGSLCSPPPSKGEPCGINTNKLRV